MVDCKAAERDGKDGKLTEKWRVPLPNATIKQATAFLEYVYCLGDYDLTVDAVHGMIGLLDRFGCMEALAKMDIYLACEASKENPSRAKFWVSSTRVQQPQRGPC